MENICIYLHDIQNTVQIKIGIQVGNTPYYSKEEISISLYDLIDYLNKKIKENEFE